MTGAGKGAPGGGGVVATTFDSLKLGSGIALSGGNLTATYSGASATNAVWANVSHSTGKFYFELTWATAVNNARESGFGNGSAGTTSYQVGGDAASIGWGGAGGVLFNGSFVSSVDQYNDPGVAIGIAVDLGAALMWFKDPFNMRWNGAAIGSQNPATGTGGIALMVGSAPFFPMLSTFANGDSVTANFGATSYAYTPPSGFGNW